MGLVRARIELANAKNPAIKPMTVDALVDTGALLLCAPEHVAVQLGLEELERREVTTADGTTYLGALRGACPGTVRKSAMPDRRAGARQ